MNNETKRKVNKHKRRKQTFKKHKKTNKCIAIITIPVNPGLNYEYSHVVSKKIYDLLSLIYKCRIVCVKYDDPQLFNILDSCHGCILPPESKFNLKACNQSESLKFFNSCYDIYKYSINRNKEGYFFPVLGICRSFQNIILFEKYKRKIKSQKYIDPCGDSSSGFFKVKLVNKSYPLHFVVNPNKSIIFKNTNKEQIKLLTKTQGVPHFNNFGFHYDEVKKYKWFNSNFNVITYSFDHLKNKIVNTIEHKKYPIYAIQFHPEEITNCHFIYSFYKSILNKSKVKNNKSPSNIKNKKKIKHGYFIIDY